MECIEFIIVIIFQVTDSKVTAANGKQNVAPVVINPKVENKMFMAPIPAKEIPGK